MQFPNGGPPASRFARVSAAVLASDVMFVVDHKLAENFHLLSLRGLHHSGSPLRMKLVAVVRCHFHDGRLLGKNLPLGGGQRRVIPNLLGDGWVEADEYVEVNIFVVGTVVELAVAALLALYLNVVQITHDAVNLAFTQRGERVEVVAVVLLVQSRRQLG